MFKNTFKIAVRRLMHHKGSGLINIIGLGLAVACCVLILRYVQHEFSYDTFHADADHIYRVVTEQQREEHVEEYAHTPLPMAQALDALPDVDQVVFFSGSRTLLVKSDEALFYQEGIAAASADFFNVFDFPLQRGNPQTALVDPYSIVLTEDVSQAVFGSTDVIGHVLNINEHDYTITGILGTMPSNAHMSFKALRSWSTFRAEYGDFADRILNSWGSLAHTYLLLHEHAEPSVVEEKLSGLVSTLRPENMDPEYAFRLQSLTDIHLGSNLVGELEPPGSVRLVYVLISVALLILLIACINYVNLATARSISRSTDFVLLVGFAFILAVPLAYLAMNRWLEDFAYHIDISWSIPLLSGLIAVVIAVLTVSYQALRVALTDPVKVLRHN